MAPRTATADPQAQGRRNLPHYRAIVALAVILLVSVLASCGGDDQVQSAPENDPAQFAQAAKEPSERGRVCSPEEFPVMARTDQEEYGPEKAVRVLYEFSNRSSTPCVFPHFHMMRFMNENGQVVWTAGPASIDCPSDPELYEECRYVQPGQASTGGDEWLQQRLRDSPDSPTQRAPTGTYRVDIEFEVEDPERPEPRVAARYQTSTAPFRLSS